MIDVVALQVRIGLVSTVRGLKHLYPDFNRIDRSLRESMDWSAFIDLYGGWSYDKVSGHKDDDTANGSPRGIWLGMLLVPEDFANAAVDLFPEQCNILSDAQAKKFYEDRVTVDQPDDFEDTEALQAMAARLVIEEKLGITPSAKESNRRVDALNPDKRQRGIRKNETKTWEGYKSKKGLKTKR